MVFGEFGDFWLFQPRFFRFLVFCWSFQPRFFVVTWSIFPFTKPGFFRYPEGPKWHPNTPLQKVLVLGLFWGVFDPFSGGTWTLREGCLVVVSNVVR